MAKKKRVTKKELLKEPDEFLTFSAKAIRFVANNQKPVLGIVIGLVVVALAVAGFRYFSNLSERRAHAMFEQARLQYLAEISGDKTGPALKKAGEQFEEVIEKYRSTNAARFSLLLYAETSYHGGTKKRSNYIKRRSAVFREKAPFKNLSGTASDMPMRPKKITGPPRNVFRR